ncbi:sensor histidine kinase [Kordia jejudonensis]|uniref:sensor histidine kinase n=1 Tax=Kordia jejudonensis TaxID=1348245 RepID=UPI0012E03B14|nr:ATP-binding protein [Kordia jejudonensis]
MKRRAFILLLLFSTYLVAQNSNIPTAEAISLFEQFEEKSEEFAYKRSVDSMEVYLGKIDTLVSKINDSSYYYRAELLRGALLLQKTQSDEALKILLKATEFFRLQKEYRDYYRGRFKIAKCYYYSNQREDVIEIMSDIIKNKKYVSDKLVLQSQEKIGAMNIEIGMMKKDSSLFRKANTQLREVIQKNIQKNDYDELASNYGLLAESFNQLQQKDITLKLLDSSIYYAKKSKNISEEGFALIKKGNLFREREKYEQATKMLQKAVDIFKKENDTPLLIYAYFELKKLLKQQQKYKQAADLGDEIYHLAIIQYNKRFAYGISEMRTRYKTAEKERQILEQRAEIAEKGLQLQERQYQIYGALGLALLFCLIGYLFYNQQKLKNRQLIKENKLKVALKEIETQNKLQEQRLQISRDLHDNIGAQLSFIISSIDNLKYASKDASDQFKDKLSYISEFTSSTIDQLRDTIWAMNKDEISISDLQSRTLAFIEKAKVAKEHIKFKFNNDVETTIQFSAIEGMHLFRVIQEAINNSLKYAKADLVTVAFAEQNKQLIFTITDNGIGFEKETVQLGNGLYNMQKRMDEINAHIDINSVSNEGTKITVKFHV